MSRLRSLLALGLATFIQPALLDCRADNVDVFTDDLPDEEDLDVVLDSDVSGARPVDVMSFRVDVKSEPACLVRAGIQLQAAGVVH